MAGIFRRDRRISDVLVNSSRMFVKIAWILITAISAAALLEGLFQLVGRVRSWPPGTVSKIRWIALLLVALGVIAFLEYNVRPPVGPGTPAIGERPPNGPVATVERPPEESGAIVEPQPERPSFGGSWNDRSAFGIAWPEPRSPENPDGTTDTFQKSFFVSIQGVDTRVLLTSRSEGGCQGCQIVLSVFSFEKKNSKWFLVNEARDFTKLGRQTFNNLPEITDVALIGPSRFGITFTVNS